MTKLISKSWIAAPVGAVVYLVATIFFWQTPKPPPPAKAGPGNMPFVGPSWEFNNPEADQLIAELKSEKKSLDLRQEQLDALAARLQSERAELGQVTQSVRQLQTDFDSSVVRVKGDESANLKKLAKIYGTMTPESSSSILAKLDNQAMVKIFAYLKDDQVGAILDALARQGDVQARRAAQLSDLMRLTMRDPNAK